MLRAFKRSLLVAFACLVVWLALRRTNNTNTRQNHDAPLYIPGNGINSSDLVNLSVVAPCDMHLLLAIGRVLPEAVKYIHLVCHSDQEGAFVLVREQMERNMQVQLDIHRIEDGLPSEYFLLKAAASANTPIVLILDSNESTIRLSDAWIKQAMKQLEALPLPVGPCGYEISDSKEIEDTPPSSGLVGVLYPPMLLSRTLAYASLDGLGRDGPIWVKLARRIFQESNLDAGGFALLADDPVCEKTVPPQERPRHASKRAQRIRFGVFFDKISHLQSFQTTYCDLVARGHHVVAELAGDDVNAAETDGIFVSRDCFIRYRHDSNLHRAPSRLDVVLVLSDHSSTLRFASTRLNHDPQEHVLIHLDRRDLQHCDWMATLSLREWRAWHFANLEITVITNNRPRSLSRLLASLNSALYFGHSTIPLTICMELTADPETRFVVQRFDWNHGKVNARHRVVMGGLIPAIVESWYPSNNHSYGLILEDDVEVSPLYFAWIKMSLLRYRYSSSLSGRSSLYGISLYSPKNVELRPNGRIQWSAQSLFQQAGLAFPLSPYLSATPCSWGAVYFPEVWREFHDYLVLRLSEQFVPLEAVVVPNIRSNRWKKSWKRFFIEMVWIRGLVMLYPNYQDFVSFSTNHLEIGSHVADASAKARKKALFVVPLMPLEESHALLEQLPNRQLPTFESLPVVDFFGNLTSIQTLQGLGIGKHSEICQREWTPTKPDVAGLWCESSYEAV